MKVVFARPHGPASYEPFSTAAVSTAGRAGGLDGDPPIHTLPAEQLTARLLEEYVFAQVTWMIASAFACEQAARFAAMDASHRNLEGLRRAAAAEQPRRSNITSEILEVATASMLLTGGGR